MNSPQDDGGRTIRAAGAVLWRNGATGPEFALVHRPRYDDWSFPKGKVDRGEHVLSAVVREVHEETGCFPLLGRRLSSAHYMVGDQAKRVDYWAASVRRHGSFTPDHEVDLVEWLPAEEAVRRLSYARDVDLLNEALSGPLRTLPFVILRHASAGEKSRWEGDDTLRPLDAKGRADAAALSRVLDGLGPLRPISSATARCVETILPYAAARDLSLTTDRAFTVGRAVAETAADRMMELIGDGVPALVCGHGEIISGMVGDLCGRLGVKEPEGPALRKASFWILQLSRMGLVSLERHSIR